MKIRALMLVLVLAPAGLAAQDAVPTGMEALELGRSRACVPILAELDRIEATLEPLGVRSQRLLAIGQAIALEDRAAVDPLHPADPTEAAVAAWFDADMALAQRFVDTGDESIQDERTAARQAIRDQVAAEFDAVQAEAQGHIDAAGDLSSGSALCEGMILVRSAVVEACQGVTSRVCDEVGATSPGGDFRFVDAPSDLWDVSEFRPWTQPGPIRRSPNGQIAGARTLGFARRGNVVISVALAPLLQQRSALAPERVSRLESIVDSLGMEFSHPDIVFVPSIGLRVNLPQPIAGETFYVLHLGAPEAADVIWTGPAATGEPIVATVPLLPSQAVPFASGEPISFTAVITGEDGENEAVFSIELTPVSQASAVQTLLGYMSGQLSVDLGRIAPAQGSVGGSR